MKNGFPLFIVIVGLISCGPLIRAQPKAEVPIQLGPETPLPHEDRRSATARLIREDARAIISAQKSHSPDAPESDAKDVLVLDRVMVKGTRPPVIPPSLQETGVEEFFRTGVIAEKVGPKVTRRFWVRGDKGVMLSFSW